VKLVSLMFLCCIAGLQSEQRAVVDFLILAQCQAFVGFGPSTFSVFLREFKQVTGLPSVPAFFVSGISKIFQEYARVSVSVDPS